MITFQELIQRLDAFWQKQGCILHLPYDIETGAGTFNPATFIRCLGPEPYNAAYVEPSRRPTDGRYGENPNRVQMFHQYQVVLKPSPPNIQDLYLQSLEHIGIDLSEHDVRFVHDDWESPTLGAWGLGWEVWMDGMEVTQFTYFQACGGVELKPVTGEITYGLERLAMFIQGVDNFFDLQWNDAVTYGDLFHRNEVEWSQYNFEMADSSMWLRHFDDQEREAKRLVDAKLPLPAIDFVLKASHSFNILDARSAISVTERTGYISRIRNLSRMIAEAYLDSREAQGWPLMKLQADKPAEHPPLPPIPQLAEGREDFLFEIGSEELPATFVPIGQRGLRDAVEQLLKDEGVPYDSIDSYATPRRLAVIVHGLSTTQPKQTEERRGPAVASAFDSNGQPTRPAEGFFGSIGMPAPTLQQVHSGAIDSVTIREVKGKEYLFAASSKGGRTTAEILTEKLGQIVLALKFPKSMRWGDGDISYARPLHWIVALFGSQVIPVRVGDVISGNISRGHRQLSRGDIEITTAAQYVEALRERNVMVNVDERRQTIEQQLDSILTTHTAQAAQRLRVLQEVLHLTEWPQLTVADFDKKFLDVPKEVLISEMVEHQRYFPLVGTDGALLPQFVITADNTPTDAIRQGNCRVLSARLSDGAFLFKTDLQQPLESLNEKLKVMTFQKELGTVFEKVERLQEHVKVLVSSLPNADLNKALRAALLSKADLASQMVYEFPELQGVMGREYAQHGGEDPEVAQAIEEQWQPQGESDNLPESPTGVVLSITDKVDNLIACFGAGMKPTSSSDPYALRRQLLGLVRIIIQHKIAIPLQNLFEQCFCAFPAEWQDRKETVVKEIMAFATNRVKTVFQGYGFGKDEIEAALSGGIDDIYSGFCKVQALHTFRQNDSRFPLLLEVYKRASGQINGHDLSEVNTSLLKEQAELALHDAVKDIREQFESALSQQRYDEAYGLIAQLQGPLSTLFDTVKVLADDDAVRNNRIALLQQVMGLFDKLLDFGKIQGG